MRNSEQAKQLFLEAVEIESKSAQSTFLDRVCGENADLRAEVESLLAAFDSAPTFMERAFAERVVGRSKGLQVGDQLGVYRLVDFLGEGGGGQVFAAVQSEPVARQVAIKIMRSDFHSEELKLRFAAERQALAMMEHPNIATVFDAGHTDQGHPFIVMEFAKGLPITEFCDEQQMGINDRLDLFSRVCEAVQHAHTKGIIHRDIKPSNVIVSLVDGKPTPKVIDFGVAKSSNQELVSAGVTRTPQMIGTPVYMSPEQAAMESDIDTRSDIFSLGILLFELLTGAPPLDHRDLAQVAVDEMCRIIRDQRVPKPSARIREKRNSISETATRRATTPSRLIHVVEGDLDWIVLKSLSEDRAKRYQSALEFADDIRRCLHNEAVEARPPSKLYRFQKFARKNRAGVLATVATMTVLVAATIYSRQQAKLALQSEKIARAAKQTEVERRRDIETVLDFVVGVLKSPDPEKNARSITIAEVLDQSAANINDTFADNALVRAEIQGALAQVYQGLGLVEESVAQARHAVAASESLEIASKDQIARALTRKITLGTGLLNSAEPEEAFVILEKVHEEAETQLGVGDSVTWNAALWLASAARECRKTDVAIELLNEILPAVESDELFYNASFDLSRVYRNAGKFREALQVCETAYKKAIVELEDPSYAIFEMGDMLQTIGRTTEADQLLNKALVKYEDKFGRSHPYTIKVMNSLAINYERLGRRDEARKIYREAIAHVEDKPQSVLNWGLFQQGLARCLEADRCFEEAAKILEKTLDRVSGALGLDSPRTLSIADRLANNYGILRQGDRAVEVLEPVYRATRDKVGFSHITVIDATATLSRCLTMVDRAGDAEAYLLEVMDANQENVRPEMWASLGMVLTKLGRADEAQPIFETYRNKMRTSGYSESRILGRMATFASHFGEWELSLNLRRDILAQLKTANASSIEYLRNQVYLAGTKIIAAEFATDDAATLLQEAEPVLRKALDKLDLAWTLSESQRKRLQLYVLEKMMILHRLRNEPEKANEFRRKMTEIRGTPT